MEPVPKLSVPRRKELARGSESETREPDSDRLSQPSVDSQPGEAFLSNLLDSHAVYVDKLIS